MIINKIYKTVVRLLVESKKFISGNLFFGFVYGHDALTLNQITTIKSMIGAEDQSLVEKFEHEFAKKIGSGQCVSYAAGRMGFFSLMQTLNIGAGDEVILTGYTCSVMVTAVLRTGATPVFADVDTNTYGSSATEIEKKLTSRTRLIVAQHSFGIPCKISPIVDLARSHKIFLLEDCALTFGSKIDGVVVGNFGDAALFSTDHSKPINTLVGGLIYSKDGLLLSRLREKQKACQSLTIKRQNALWRRLELERKYCTPHYYRKLGLREFYERLRKALIAKNADFLSDDSDTEFTASYPYPAKFPPFLAALGLIELEGWDKTLEDRKRLFQDILTIFESHDLGTFVTKSFRSKVVDVIPLRFAFHLDSHASLSIYLSEFIQIDWVWFKRPIIATKIPLQLLCYKEGTCKNSEEIGPKMINLPCNVPVKYHSHFLRRLDQCILSWKRSQS